MGTWHMPRGLSGIIDGLMHMCSPPMYRCRRNGCTAFACTILPCSRARRLSRDLWPIWTGDARNTA
eukprot:7383638-Prymnesium_polylepis.1